MPHLRKPWISSLINFHQTRIKEIWTKWSLITSDKWQWTRSEWSIPLTINLLLCWTPHDPVILIHTPNSQKFLKFYPSSIRNRRSSSTNVTLLLAMLTFNNSITLCWRGPRPFSHRQSPGTNSTGHLLESIHLILAESITWRHKM
jgi:hypothetical protein